MIEPRILHTHTWDGTTVPDWLTGHHHWNGNQLVIRHPDGTTPIQTGWIIAYWSDGTCTVGSPRTAERVYGPHGIHGQLQRAEAALDRIRAALDEPARPGIRSTS